MSTKTRCDTCGTDIDTAKTHYEVSITKIEKHTGSMHEFDVCASCIAMPLKASKLREIIRRLLKI